MFLAHRGWNIRENIPKVLVNHIHVLRIYFGREACSKMFCYCHGRVRIWLPFLFTQETPWEALLLTLVSWGPTHDLSVNSLHFSERYAKSKSQSHLCAYNLNGHFSWLMRKALHNLTLYSVASSAIIRSHCPVPTHLRVAIALKIYLALFLVHTQLSTQFLHLWKLCSFPCPLVK